MTNLFPNEERFGLTSQMRRCVYSIPSNIAEGCGRNSKKELLHFLGISVGSCNELETQLEIAQRIGLVDPNVCKEIIDETVELRKMILGFAKMKTNN